MEPLKSPLSQDLDFVTQPLFSEKEEEILVKNLQIEKIFIKTSFHSYLINTRILKPFSKAPKSILFLHGHGDSPSWRSWIKLAIIFFELNFNCFLIDLPGFGHSLVNDEEGVSFKTWQDDGVELYKLLLEKLSVEKVFVIARCGGAALTIRTICKYPELFENSHIFHNNMISGVPDAFVTNFNKYGMKLFSTWKEDPDHQKFSVGYKWYNSHRKKQSKFLFFMDIEETDLQTHYIKNLNYKKNKRRLKNYQIMSFSQKYLDFVINFILNNKFQEF